MGSGGEPDVEIDASAVIGIARRFASSASALGEAAAATRDLRFGAASLGPDHASEARALAVGLARVADVLTERAGDVDVVAAATEATAAAYVSADDAASTRFGNLT
ncbi:hypothetical protein DW322_09645 [Rhodococcus rhodnii]|uniref:Uncharacterized protein n=2 Tax=Rhodococcus rhodnii TaxID=38312 RepID=R7WRV8_9NOCA|nr:hypothetical protein [Rhodococcus rhodnii]EOM78072.1 hypothetical protein Rrhod_0561 [Rhodococcus rhodnii LMG 5362]TXG90438.1 hypothetical protein DW322_09645 [Rhodococcus rhodnii]